MKCCLFISLVLIIGLGICGFIFRDEIIQEYYNILGYSESSNFDGETYDDSILINGTGYTDFYDNRNEEVTTTHKRPNTYSEYLDVYDDEDEEDSPYTTTSSTTTTSTTTTPTTTTPTTTTPTTTTSTVPPIISTSSGKLTEGSGSGWRITDDEDYIGGDSYTYDN